MSRLLSRLWARLRRSKLKTCMDCGELKRPRLKVGWSHSDGSGYVCNDCAWKWQP